MKVALLLSGGMRDWIIHYVYFKKHLLDLYDVDVFLSTWKHDKLTEVSSVYNPVAIDVQDYNKGFDTRWKSITNPYEKNKESNVNLVNCMAMWYKTWRVNELKNEYQFTMNTKYDLVIKTRPDLRLESDVILEKPKNNTLYIPKGWDWSGGVNDLFAYGTSEVINVYSDLFRSFPRLMKECRSKLNPEILLRNYINNFEGIKLERPEIDITLRDINIKQTYNFTK
jgi:hypothetical protein